MSRKLVISPSGNFYGSEQVLFDYLQHTKFVFDVVVPKRSLFYIKLEEAKTNHRIHHYNNGRLPAFYVWVFWQLLIGKYSLVYLNEAGHVKYLKMLARIFGKKDFVVHVRMLEDTNASRWGQGVTGNLTVLAISKYISKLLPVKNRLLYDAYPFSNKSGDGHTQEPEVLRIAIIGRITKTKGIGLLPGLIELIQNKKSEGKYIFQLYGEIADDLRQDELLDRLQQSKAIIIKGFEANKESIYHSVDCVLHLSKQEALGRIFFEALDHYKPFIGFNAAGIGEIAEMLEIGHWLADPNASDPVAEIYTLLGDLIVNYKSRVCEIELKRKQAKRIFDPSIYQDKLDNLLSA